MASSATESIEQRTEMRRRNKNPAPFRSAFSAQQLKCDLKKATALAKRFGNYSADASEKTILSQLSFVSFGMFLSEAAQGVVHSLCQGTKMKIADAHSFAVVCSEVHQRYEAFWPHVRQSLREHAERILDVEAIRAEIERVEEIASASGGSASAAVPCPTGTTPTATAAGAGAAMDALGAAAALVPSSANVNALGVGGGSANAGAPAVPALEELSRLRLIARVFCEWFLLGLIDDAGPLQKILKLVNTLLSRRRSGSSGASAAMTTSPTVVSSLVAVAVLIVREVGIELLGSANAALRLLFPADMSNDHRDSTKQLRALTGYFGELVLDRDPSEMAHSATNAIQLGPAGARVVFTAATHNAVAVDDAAARSAADISMARLRDAKDHPSIYACATLEEQRQFMTLSLSIARTAVAAYDRCRGRVKGAWQRLSEQEELRGRTARHVAAEAQFRAYHEEVERLYAQCDALLGMMGYSAPDPIDLARATQKSTTDVTITLRGQLVPGEVETVNRFANGEQRVFYEYIPRLQALPEEMIPSLTAQKANWDLVCRHRGATNQGNVNNSNNTGKQQARNAFADDKAYDGANLHDSSLGKDEDDYYDYDDDKDEKAASTVKQTPAEFTAARRRRHMSELSISPTEYAPVLQLLDNFERCVTPSATDEWCEGFFQEALRPLCHAENEQGVSAGCVFFTNCRMLLTLEMRHFPVARWPEMLPFAARCVATVHQYFPDTGEFVARMMEAMWRGSCQHCSATEVPNKFGETLAQRRVSGAVRYLCELMKFGVSPPIRVLGVVRTAVEDLQHRLIASAVATAIEHGGLFLMRGPVTRPVMEAHMTKLRNRLQHVVLDEDSLELIKDSFAALQPPAPVQRAVAKTRPPLEEYARYLIFNELSTETYKTVLEKMLLMPWGDPNIADALARTMRKTHRLAWDAVPCLADLLADLARAGHTSAAHYVIDSVVEDIRRDLEFVGRALAARKAQPGPRASIGIEDQRLNPVLTSSIRAGHRPLQWRIVDCQFIAQLYRARLVNLRFVALALLTLLHYAPSATPVDDCARARCFVTLLGSCVGHLTWRSFPYGGAVERPKVANPSKPFLARLRWSVDRILAQQQVVRRLVARLFVHMHEDIAGLLPFDLRYRVEGLVEAVNEAVGQLYAEASDETIGSELRGILGEVTLPQPLVLPETPEAARAFVSDVLDAEPLRSINGWYGKLCDTVLSAETTHPFRLFTDLVGFGQLTGQPTAPLGLTRDGNSSGYVSGDNDDENRMDEESGEEGAVLDNEVSDEEGEVDDEDEEEEDEEGEADDDEEDDDDSEEDEDEEEYEDEEEDEDEGEHNPLHSLAVAAALRKQQEDEEFDAELRALRMDTTRTVPVKGAPAPLLIEKELALGIRQHRQRQQQQQQQQQERKEEGDGGTMMRFAVLQRHVGKAPAGAAAQAAPVLCLPRDLQFAQSVSAQHEMQRQHKEELRAITVRINRMQEEENSDISKTRKK